MKYAWVILVSAAACTLGTGSFAGKTCKTNVECPDPYVCALVRPEGRTCELVRGVETFDPSADNPADYCNDVKPILDKSCVFNCHGAQMDYVGSPKTFRLDRYEKVGAILGAGDKAFNINDRMSKGTMPPAGVQNLTYPTAKDTGVVLRWLNSGAPFCLDGGMTADGGSDGGTGDAGDGG